MAPRQKVEQTVSGVEKKVLMPLLALIAFDLVYCAKNKTTYTKIEINNTTTTAGQNKISYEKMERSTSEIK